MAKPNNQHLLPVEPLRKAVLDKIERGEITWAEIAVRAGYVYPDPNSPTKKDRADTNYIRKVCGVIQDGRPGNVNKQLKVETLVKILKAIHVDPIDIGY